MLTGTIHAALLLKFFKSPRIAWKFNMINNLSTRELEKEIKSSLDEKALHKYIIEMQQMNIFYFNVLFSVDFNNSI